MTVMWMLFFILYRPAGLDHEPLDAAEMGYVVARSCEAAEAWVRAGLRDGQEVQFGRCVPVETREARR